MKRAHQIAKTLEGDYRARMSIALRQAWQEAKKEAKKEVVIKVTGNTYPARHILKEAGFVWDKDAKAYFGDERAMAELDRISTPTYSLVNRNLVADLDFEEIEKDLEEQARKEKKGMKKNYASYHIDGSKADEFRAAALELFASKDALIKVTGDTYPARYILREAGFVWNRYEKAYFGDKSAKAELDRISTASYSRTNQRLVAALKIEEIEKGPELKKELQWRMCNLDRETMSFDLIAGPNTPKDILDLAEKFGVGENSYA